MSYKKLLEEYVKEEMNKSMSYKSIKKISACFELLLDNIFFETDYKDDEGYLVRRVNKIPAQLIKDVEEAIQQALNNERD